MTDVKFVNILGLDESVVEKVREWRNSDSVRRFMLTQHVISRQEHAKWIESLRHGDKAVFWVVFIEGNPAGAAYLMCIDGKKRASEWGFYIGDDAYRGKGLGKRIFFKLMRESFEQMKFETLLTKVFSDNTIALGLYSNFNFVEKDKTPFDGGREVISLAFTKNDWVRIREKLSNDA